MRFMTDVPVYILPLPPACRDVWEIFSPMMPAGRRMENKSFMHMATNCFWPSQTVASPADSLL